MGYGLRMAVAGVLAAGVLGCGQGAQKIGGGKEGAVAALSLINGSTKNSGSLMLLAGQPVTVSSSGEASVTCEHGGTAAIKGFTLKINTGATTTLEQSYTLTFDKCAAHTYDNPDTAAIETEKIILDGSMTVAQNIAVTTGGAGNYGNVSQTLKGKITFGGAFNDYLDANVTEKLDWAALSAKNAQVSIVVDGTIATSSESHTFSNETHSIKAGVIVAHKH